MYAEGYYKGRTLTWGLTETSNGHPQFWSTFDVTGALDPNRLDAAPKPCEPGTGRWTITITDNSADWFIRTAHHLGYDRNDLDGLNPDSEQAFDFEGREITLKCKHEEYQGQQREKWSVVIPPAKLSADKVAALNERFGRKFKEAKERHPIKEVAPKAEAPKKDATVPF